MAVRADESWAAAEVAEIVSRQNGKNAIVEARELFGLVILNEMIIHTSHLFTTTRESYARLLSLVEGHPDVKDQLVYSVASPASGYEMRFRDGGRIRFIARSRSSGRGLTGDLLVFDEAQDLSDDAQGALLPTISARPGAQAWYQGSAPNDTSEVLHRIRARGRSGSDDRLAYLEYSADPDAAPDDRAAWQEANPALGIRITEEAIEAELGAMSTEMFLRERLSVSPDLTIGGRVISREVWNACLDESTSPVGVVAYAIDVSPDREAATLAVAGRSVHGGTHLEVIEHRKGTAWLVGRVREVQAKWGGAVGVASGSPAASLIPELEAAGVQLVEVSTAEHAQACGAFFDAATEQELKHRGDPALNSAVDGAERKFYGDAWLWSRRAAAADITPLVAVTLAKWAYDQRAPAMAVPEAILL